MGRHVSNLNAFARGVNYYASMNLFLPEEYIANTQTDVFQEWTADQVAAVLTLQGIDLS
jgi:hypothetical protein